MLGSSFQCYLKFFLAIEFAAAIELFSAFQILMEGKNMGGFSVSAHFNKFFSYGLDCVTRGTGTGHGSLCGVLQ